MIPITKIDENLSIYKNNTVILWGIDEKIFLLLKSFEIDTKYFCDDKELDEKEFCGVPIISKNELAEIISDNKNIVVQISSKVKNAQEVVNYLEEKGIKKYIFAEEALQILNCIKKAEAVKLAPTLERTTDIGTLVVDTYRQIFYKNIMQDLSDEVLLVCMPRKTGDFTINKTLVQHKIKFFNMWHTPDIYDEKILLQKYKKVKIISAVREPISQRISNLYEEISNIEMSFMRIIDGKIFDNAFTDIDDVVKNGGNVQKIFDRRNEIMLENFGSFSTLGNFFDKFNENIMGIMNTPFDTEKGFSVIKKGNVEVFVYQLEKIDNVASELAEFVDGDFSEWTTGNIANDKWISKSYEQAKKELVFSQNFLDRCYDESYVKHFYSEADIEKFKDKWKKNMKI